MGWVLRLQKRVHRTITHSNYIAHSDRATFKRFKLTKWQTVTKTLAEANARDNYFAIGMPLTHPEALDSTKWSENGNQLGEILMELRVELST